MPPPPPTQTPTACPECEYSLEGLPTLSREHPCPECGYPAKLYAPPEQWLRHADHRWLDRVSRGLRLLVFSQRWLLGFVIAMLAWLVTGSTLAFLIDVDIMGPDSHWTIDTLFWAVLSVGVGSHVIGVVLATTPPSAPTPPDAPARKLARTCGVLFAPAITASTFGLIYIPQPPLWAHYAIAAVFTCNAICYLTAEPRWLRTLDWRTAAWRPDMPRRHRTARRTLYWMIGLTLLLDTPWDLFHDARPSPANEELLTPQWWWIFMLIAFLVTTDAVTRPVLVAVRSERNQTGPSGPTPT